MKYSCCLYPTGKETLEQAENLMLEEYCVKAKLQDGMDVLDLGCGWGSLTLFLAKVRFVICGGKDRVLEEWYWWGCPLIPRTSPLISTLSVDPLPLFDSILSEQKYPNSRITSLSNSATQKLHIDSQAALRGLSNVEVFTGDVKVYDFKGVRS